MSHGEHIVSPTAVRLQSSAVVSWLAAMSHANSLGYIFAMISVHSCHDV